MNKLKEKNMLKSFNGHTGAETLSHIKELLGNDLNHLSGKDLGLVMSAINRAYHEGRASTGAEMIDSNAVWIESLGKVIEWEEKEAEWIYEQKTVNGLNGLYPKKIKDGVLFRNLSMKIQMRAKQSPLLS